MTKKDRHQITSSNVSDHGTDYKKDETQEKTNCCINREVVTRHPRQVTLAFTEHDA
jgi:hypothetical protein